MMWMLAQSATSTAQPAAPPRRAPLDEIANHFDSGAMIPMQWIAIATGLVILVIGSISFYKWHRGRHKRSNPPMVFHRVAKQSGLSTSQQMLLWRIARQQALPTPLTLLMSPATLEHHAAAYAAGKSAGGRASVMGRVAAIRGRVFRVGGMEGRAIE